MNIVNVGYDSTNYYVLADTRPRLLLDVGWPGTLPKLQHACKRMGINLAEIPYLLATHYHPDHAGLAQEVKGLGIKLLVIDIQIPFIPTLATYMKPENHYVPIEMGNNVTLTLAESREFLETLGIKGEIISTPGHSDDSVSLVLDEGAAFTGDLTHPMMADEVSKASWGAVRAIGAKRIYPGHGPVW